MVLELTIRIYGEVYYDKLCYCVPMASKLATTTKVAGTKK